MNQSSSYDRHARLTLAMLLLLPCVACERSSPTAGVAESSHGSHAQEHAEEHGHAHAHGHSHEHEHAHPADHADTLPTAVARVQGLLQSVEDHFAQGTPAKADEALHALAVLTERLPGLAAETDLPESAWTKVRESSSRLMEQLSRIHAEFHTGGKVTLDYTMVKPAIDAELSALAAVVGQLPAAKAGESIDDSERDHETTAGPQ